MYPMRKAVARDMLKELENAVFEKSFEYAALYRVVFMLLSNV